MTQSKTTNAPCHHRFLVALCLLVLGGMLLAGCQLSEGAILLPTLIPTAEAVGETGNGLPPTWTPAPVTDTPSPTPYTPVATAVPTQPGLPIPTNTPVTPSPTPTITPSPTSAESPTPEIKPLEDYDRNEVIPLEAFPRPPGDNGWGIHWFPNVKQEPAVVDHYVNQLIRMHIRWVIFLNDNTNIGDNDYLVERLVGAKIMPVMRVYRSDVTPFDGDLGEMVAHYRAKGVYYFQLYNEPNTNEENGQGFANPNQYALTWASAAREVINHGGLPGIGAFSPGGAYNHYSFLEGTLRALQRNGDIGLLNHSWLSVHNYHGLRRLDDVDGFLLFRKYDEIVRIYLGRSMPMIGTEGGSYHPNPQVEKDLLASQYGYMRVAEPYFMAFSHWLIGNQVGGSNDTRWEYQALFRNDFVHPLVTEFFYKNRR